MRNMLPVGLLMIEHRLIERMIKLIAVEAVKIDKGQAASFDFERDAVDFFKNYADLCHHGKEEGILFKNLMAKPLSMEHRRLLTELTEEHIYARKKTRDLEKLKQRLERGDNAVRPELVMALQDLAEFYPRHIEKEDKDFFLPCMGYFSTEEQDSMLSEFAAYDQGLIHEKYQSVIISWER